MQHKSYCIEKVIILLLLVDWVSVQAVENLPYQMAHVTAQLSKTSIKNGDTIRVTAEVANAPSFTRVIAEVRKLGPLNPTILGDSGLIDRFSLTPIDNEATSEPGLVKYLADHTFTRLSPGQYAIEVQAKNLLDETIARELLFFTDPIIGKATEGTPNYPNGGLTRVAELNSGGSTGSGDLTCAVKSSYPYAFFGLNGTPGSIVRIQTNTLVETGRLRLDENEGGLRTAGTDPDRRYAYFGTDTIPAQIIKVDLVNFRKVSSIQLDESYDGISSEAVDSQGQYAYFATDISDLEYGITKVDLTTFTVAAQVVLSGSGPKNLLISGDDTTIYVACSGNYSIDKIDTATIQHIASLDVSHAITAGVLDPIANLIFYCTSDSGYILKVDLASFTVLSEVDAPGINLTTIVLLPGRTYIVYSNDSTTTDSVVGKMRTSDLVVEETTTFSVADYHSVAVILDTERDELIYGSTLPAGSERMIRVDYEPTLQIMNTIGITPDGTPIGILTDSAIDSRDGRVYACAGNYAGAVIRIDPSAFNIEAELYLADYSTRNARIEIDPIGDALYVMTDYSTHTPPSYLTSLHKIELNSFDITITRTLGSNELASDIILDANGTFLYVCLPSQDKLMKYNASYLGFIRSLTVEAAEFCTGVIEPTGAYGYFTNASGIGKVYKVQLDTMTLVDTLTFPSNFLDIRAVVHEDCRRPETMKMGVFSGILARVAGSEAG